MDIANKNLTELPSWIAVKSVLKINSELNCTHNVPLRNYFFGISRNETFEIICCCPEIPTELLEVILKLTLKLLLLQNKEKIYVRCKTIERKQVIAN